MSRITAILAFPLVAALLLSFGWIFNSAFAADTSPDDLGHPLARVSPQTTNSFHASSNEPGIVAQYTITFTATADYAPGSDNLVIELEDFRFPSNISPSSISIWPEGSDAASPQSVTAEPRREKLNITLPDFDPATSATDADADKINSGESVTVTIQQSAGIYTPTEGGNYEAVISGPGADVTTAALNIHRVVKLSVSEGRSGTAVTATGRGFKNGTTLGFFLDSNFNGMRDSSGEIVLCEVRQVGADDTGSCSFTVSSPPFALGDNYVSALDGRGQYAFDATSDEQKFVLLPDPTATPAPTPRPTATPHPTPRPTATPYPTPTPTPRPAVAPAVPAATTTPPQLPGGNEPPHIFTGTATLNGRPTGQGIAIDAYDGGRLIGATVTQAGGRFTIHIHRSQGVITFRVNQQATAESWTAWQQGQVTTGFNLTAAGASSNEQDPSRLFAALPDLVRAFSFDNATKQWSFFDPVAADVSTLTRFVPGNIYWLLVSHTTRLMLNGAERDLSCVGDDCWNLIVW